MFSGGALSRFTVFALGIMPYISASIIMTLLTSMSEKLKAGGSKGGTYFWNPGPGAAPSMEDSFLITRWFPSVEAWGDSAMAYENGVMAKVEAGVSRVMDCSAFRLYLDYPYYWEG